MSENDDLRQWEIDQMLPGLLADLRNQEKAERREAAGLDFKEASIIAAKNGFSLIQHSESHYSIRCPKWQLDIYPGNRRIYRCKGSAPYLNLPIEWNLIDVANALALLRDRP